MKKTDFEKIQQKSEAKIRRDILANKIPHPFNNKFYKDMTLDDKIAIGVNSIKEFINAIDNNHLNDFLKLITEIKEKFGLSDEQIDNIFNDIYPKYKKQIDYLMNLLKNKINH